MCFTLYLCQWFPYSSFFFLIDNESSEDCNKSRSLPQGFDGCMTGNVIITHIPSGLLRRKVAVFPTAISSQNWPDINLSLEMEGQSQVMYNQVESINNEGDCFCVTTIII